jgi:hypothetical protein
LVDHIDFKQNGVTRMTTTKQSDKLNRLTNIVSTTNAVAANQSAYAYSLANQRTKNTHKGCHCFDASEGRQIAKHAFIRHPRNEQYYCLTPFHLSHRAGQIRPLGAQSNQAKTQARHSIEK